MEHEKEDRRTRRTRQLLREAFLSLLKEKRFEDISVQDIIERADVARSTFYVHYVDKQDLLVGKWGVFASNLGHQAEVMSHQEEENRSLLQPRGWFQHIQVQRHILKIIAKDSAMALAMKTLREILHKDVQIRIQNYLPVKESDSIPSSLIVDYLVDSLMTLLTWWVKHDMPYSPQRMDEIFQRLVMPGVPSFFPLDSQAVCNYHSSNK
jgi:hypothetical protein